MPVIHIHERLIAPAKYLRAMHYLKADVTQVVHAKYTAI